MTHTHLYEVLGLAPGAAPREIRASYRKLAQRLHPDKGGDTGDFTALQLAYDVLSDPERRERYDTTGSVVEPDRNAEMLQEFAQVVFTVLERAEDVATLDVVREVGMYLDQGTENIEANTSAAEAKIEKLRATLARLTHKGKGRDVLGDMLMSQIADIERVVEGNNAKLRGVGQMREILGVYAYRVDARRPSPIQGALSDEFYAALRGTQEVRDDE